MSSAKPLPAPTSPAAILREKWTIAKSRAQQVLAGTGSGLASAKALSDEADAMLCTAFNVEGVTLVATGGCGRQEMSAGSDLDLLFLCSDGSNPAVGDEITAFLYTLWDAGMKVGHAVRTVEECLEEARNDTTIRSSLLDARFLSGDPALYQTLTDRYRCEVIANSCADFAQDKLDQQSLRWDKSTHGRLVLEPNIKEGRGGLRDYQTMIWIARYLHGTASLEEMESTGLVDSSEAALLRKDHDFLWKIRSHLNNMAGALSDQLTFDRQIELAPTLGYTGADPKEAGQAFMWEYFRTTRRLATLGRAIAEDIASPADTPATTGLPEIEGFILGEKGLRPLDSKIFLDNHAEMVRLFTVADAQNKPVAPSAIREIMRIVPSISGQLEGNKEAGRYLVDLLTKGNHPDKALQTIAGTGLLDAIIPAWSKIDGLLHYDSYHAFPVGMHTLHAIGTLTDILSGNLQKEDLFKLPCALAQNLSPMARKVLPVALLLHDFGKGSEGDHSRNGGIIARKLAPQLGLSAEESKLTAWLVENHLLLSHTAIKHDPEDPEVLAEMIVEVETVEQLLPLAILTAADSNAVGPGRWNPWRAALVESLVHRVHDALSYGICAAADDSFEARWCTLAEDIPTSAEGPEIEFIATERDMGVTLLLVRTPTVSDIWPRLAGGIALGRANILRAELQEVEQGKSLGVFAIQDAVGQPVEETTQLQKSLHRVLSREICPADELARRKPSPPTAAAKTMAIEPHVAFEKLRQEGMTRIQVIACDRVGLLHDLTRVLTEQNLTISSAKIATFGCKAEDYFIVQASATCDLSEPENNKRIKQALLGACSPS